MKKRTKGKFKLILAWLCLIFGILMSMTNISYIKEEAVEIYATVVHTYELHGGRYKGHGPRLRVEWVDLNGKVQTEGNIYNAEGYMVGDLYPILVDAEEQEHVIRSKTNYIVGTILGILIFIVGVIWIVHLKKNLKLQKTIDEIVASREESAK